MKSVSLTLTEALLNTTEAFSAVTRVRRLTVLYKCEISELNPHTCAFEHHRVFLSSDSCA